MENALERRADSNNNLKGKIMTQKNFELALRFLFPAEGGYSNHKADKGGATNLGVTQGTYNAWLKAKGLPNKDVRQITHDEAVQIYRDNYYTASGADKVTDPKMAIALFDTAVLHGVGGAKGFYNKCGGDLNTFLELREKSYDKICTNDPTQKVFLQGWKNRVANLRKYLAKI